MPILRAGPWGNLTDSFQNVPAATNVELDHYPVNIAKGNWPNQDWTAWYEAEAVAGCCTPETIHVYWWVFTDTIEFDVSRTEEGGCEYYYYDNGSWFFSLEWVMNPYESYEMWYVETNAGFGDSGYGQVPDNQCDPTTASNIYSVGGTLLITIPT